MRRLSRSQNCHCHLLAKELLADRICFIPLAGKRGVNAFAHKQQCTVFALPPRRGSALPDTHTHTRDRAYESQRPPTSNTSPASDLLWNVTTLRHTKQVHQSSSPDRFHTGAFFGARPVRIPGTPGRKVKKTIKRTTKGPLGFQGRHTL